jgi:TfoX/Sxy family transcriptional regulator of competence genes
MKLAKKTTEEKAALATRLRGALKGRRNVTEKRMFGGTCFLLNGNMLCAAGTQGFLFRVGKDAHGEAAARPGAKAMIQAGRRMTGFIWVDPDACDARKLKSWIALAESYVSALPRKKK